MSAQRPTLPHSERLVMSRYPTPITKKAKDLAVGETILYVNRWETIHHVEFGNIDHWMWIWVGDRERGPHISRHEHDQIIIGLEES